MLIEYSFTLNGNYQKGVFDTTGFWIKYMEHKEENGEVEGYKIFGNQNFAFFHTDKEICDAVYDGILKVLKGSKLCHVIEGAGTIMRVEYEF